MCAKQIERPNFFERQYLGAQDLTSLGDYLRNRDARHALGGHTWGIAMGLELTEKETPIKDVMEIYIQPGYAWDGYGRPIVVLTPYRIPEELFASASAGLVRVWLRYHESETLGVRPGFEVCDATDEYRRVRESFKIEVCEKSRVKERQDGVSIAGEEVEDASEALRVSEDDARLICDASIPHQAFPEERDNPRWLVPLGVVRWVAGSPGHFEKSGEEEHKQTRILRRYIGLVAEGIHAADGVIRLRGRTTEAEEGKSNDEVCKRDRLTVSDLTYNEETGKVGIADLVSVEGNLRVDEDVKVSGKVGIGTSEPKFKLHIEGGTDAELSGGGFIVTGRETGVNIAIDNNEIMARNNGEKSSLFLQAGGGDLRVHSNQPEKAQFIIKDNGNVGIGEGTPGGKLHVNGGATSATYANAAAAIEIDNSGNEKSILQANGPTAPYRINIQDGHGRVSHLWNAYDSNNEHKYDADNEGSVWMRLHSGEFSIRTTPGGPADSKISWNLGLCQSSNGNVGIGKTNPQAPLHVAGDMALGPSGNEILRGDDPGTKAPTGEPNNGLLIQSAQTVEVNIDSNDIPEDMFAVTKGSARTELFRIQEDGKVGIGTTNPSTNLHIHYHSQPQLRISDNNGYWQFWGGSNLHIREANIDRFYIKNGGNIGIGMTDPTHKLTVKSSNDDTLRLIGPNSFGHGARLNFGDADYVYIEEDTDDTLKIYAKEGTSIHSISSYTTLKVHGKLWVRNFGTIGSDYAEYFESTDDNEIPIGVSVVLENGKVRQAKKNEIPIGIISANPGMAGGVNIEWPKKYLRDSFGSLIFEEYKEEMKVADENGQHAPTGSGKYVTRKRPKLNPDYDESKKYVPREDRPEWNCVGLLGQLPLRKGQPVAENWIKIKDISNDVELWLVK